MKEVNAPQNPWDERYGVDHYVYGKHPNAFLESRANLLPTGRVLCLAEGEGRNAVYLAKLGHEVTAIDASAIGLEKAQKLAAANDVEINTQVANLAEYDLGHEKWDTIVAIFAHLPPALRKEVHAACVAALKPGGHFILEAYTPKQLNYKTGGPPAAEMMMTSVLLNEELKGLEFTLNEEKVREVVEGVGHIGEGAVVQVHAIKPV